MLGLQGDDKNLFEQHRKHSVFDGVVAANGFLSYLPFGSAWNKKLQRSEEFLPDVLRLTAADVETSDRKS